MPPSYVAPSSADTNAEGTKNTTAGSRYRMMDCQPITAMAGSPRNPAIVMMVMMDICDTVVSDRWGFTGNCPSGRC